MRPEEFGFKQTGKGNVRQSWIKYLPGGKEAVLWRSYDDGEEVFIWELSVFDTEKRHGPRGFEHHGDLRDWEYEDSLHEIPTKMIDKNRDILVTEEKDMSDDRFLKMLTEDKSAWNVDAADQSLSVGDRIKVTGPVRGQGKTGRIEELLNGFCVVKTDGEQFSFQCSDVTKMPDNGGEDDLDETLTETDLFDESAFEEISDELNGDVSPSEVETIWKDAQNGVHLEDTMSKFHGEHEGISNKDVLNVIDKLKEKGMLKEAVKRPTPQKRIQIDIDGPDGNAFVLLARAGQYAKQLGLDADKIREEMKASNYINLLKVFDKYFGEYIDLVTDNEKYIDALGGMVFQEKRSLKNARTMLKEVKEKKEDIDTNAPDPVSLRVWKDFAEKFIRVEHCFTEEEFEAEVNDAVYLPDVLRDLEEINVVKRIDPSDMNPDQLRQVGLDPDFYDARPELDENDRFYVVLRDLTTKEINLANSTELPEPEAEEKWQPPKPMRYEPGQKVLVKYGKDKGAKGFFVTKVDKTFGIIKTTDGKTKKVAFDDLAMESKKLREAKEDIEFQKDEKVFTVKIEKTSVGSFFFVADTRNAGEAVGRVVRDEGIEFVPFKKEGSFEIHLNVKDFNRDQDVRKLITRIRKPAEEWLSAIEVGAPIKEVGDNAESLGDPVAIKKELDAALKGTKVKLEFVWPEDKEKPKKDKEEAPEKEEKPEGKDKKKTEEIKVENKLTAKAREALPDSAFVYQKDRRYPINDIAHARNALVRVAQHGTPSEKKAVKAAVYKKFPSLRESLQEDLGESWVNVDPLEVAHLSIGTDQIKNAAHQEGLHADDIDDDKIKVMGKIEALKSFLSWWLQVSESQATVDQYLSENGALHEDYQPDERTAFMQEEKAFLESVRDWIQDITQNYYQTEFTFGDVVEEFKERANDAIVAMIEDGLAIETTVPESLERTFSADPNDTLSEDVTDIGAPTKEEVDKAKQAMNNEDESVVVPVQLDDDDDDGSPEADSWEMMRGNKPPISTRTDLMGEKKS